jgi:hypothetical protein
MTRQVMSPSVSNGLSSLCRTAAVETMQIEASSSLPWNGVKGTQ